MVLHEFLDFFYTKNRADLLTHSYRKEDFEAESNYYLYFLIDNGEIVYIGQTTLYPTARIRQHISSNKIFDSAVPFHIPNCKNKEELTDIEAYLIVKYNPKYNQSLPKCKWLCRPKQFRKISKTCNVPYQTLLDMRMENKLKKYLIEFRDNFFFDCKKFSEDLISNKPC